MSAAKTTASRPASRVWSVVSRLLLVLGGLAFPLALLTVLLMVMPEPFLGATRYADRLFANQSLTVNFKPSDGDLFVALPGSIKPPEDDSVLESFTLAWDADGFRVPATVSDAYPIAIFGDSFTEGFNVPVPYADGVAQRLQIPVRNYGYRAYGPVEISETVAAVIDQNAAPQHLVYGYFSGNDLGDAVRPPKIDRSSPVAVWTALFNRLAAPAPASVPETTHYDFPMPVIIGGNYYEMAFLWYYWWWQLAPDAGFDASRNFAVLDDALTRMSDAVPAETCKTLLFIPTKEQLYYPYIYETEKVWVRNVAQKLVLDETDTLRMIPSPLTEADDADFIQRLYGQRDAVAALSRARGDWRFVDLTPAFEAAIAEGQLLYYPYDSHWNQAGHDLAAAVLAEALRTADCVEK